MRHYQQGRGPTAHGRDDRVVQVRICPNICLTTAWSPPLSSCRLRLLDLLHHPAPRKTLTPPELPSRPLPAFRRPQHHPPAAPRTLPRGRPDSTQPQVPNMLPISTPRLLHPPRLDHCTNFRDLPLRQHPSPERADVPSPVEAHRHVLRHFPLQLCLTDEHDHRPDHPSRQGNPFQRILYRPHMPVVLPKWILELVPPPTPKHLRPLPIPLTPENPPWPCSSFPRRTLQTPKQSRDRSVSSRQPCVASRCDIAGIPTTAASKLLRR